MKNEYLKQRNKKMALKRCWIIVAGFYVLIESCNSTPNYKNAYVGRSGNKNFIKLRGRRRYMAYDPISMIFNNTYEEDGILYLPEIKNGVIRNVYFDEGKYRYKMDGFILIHGQHLEINLSDYDSVGKQVVPYTWNGEYNLVNRK